MTENELQLVNLIRNSAHPEQAIVTALTVILDYLKQDESFEAQAPAYPQEHA
jgi:hypothetical protein